MELKLQSGILYQKTSDKLLLTVLRKINPKETKVNEVHRFIHSLIKQIMNYLLSTCCMTDTALGGAGGVMGSSRVQVSVIMELTVSWGRKTLIQKTT